MADKKQDEGQVSEVSGLRDADEQVSDGDAVAGQPDGADGGPTGPDAATFAEEQDRRPGKGDVETTG
ncbi:hypothetical protein [Nocardioides sp. YIM 152315]|uniref:hypothetical protein n=1 Tax=Nocardioides sp. YIM 152315 TaxID=3031760 RepID=UPI0023DA8E58|nr:hypothetical protein [Nocardioides sp. YIM 152315]MDF1605394.1 hypothetical protein [Nocardioides sp. YIM 152315]